MNKFIIIGGGIVGLSVGKTLLDKYPNAKITLLEKERELASHQTGNNSGVIHSGIYYTPGSYKAEFAKAGSKSMREFCLENDVKHDICGKVIVATSEAELANLQALYKRGLDNGLPVTLLEEAELKEKEPHVNAIKGIHVPTAGIVDYKDVSLKLGELIVENGGEIHLNQEVKTIEEHEDGVVVDTNETTFHADCLINCAGLQSDRIAKMAGYEIDMKIFPFRGEYFYLKEDKHHLVNHLIYPVPNPDFPFLGVHFTRMMNGNVDVGPNAVPGFKREAYNKLSFNMKDFFEIITYPGFWKMGMANYKEGMEEVIRSFSKKLFVKNAQQLIPEIREDDLIVAPAGVRAQALKKDGSLVDDFFIINGKNSVHVCNAPSPAATAALEIGKEIVENIVKMKENMNV